MKLDGGAYFQNTVNLSGNSKITSTATYSDDGNNLLSTTDALAKTTEYGYNIDTNVLEWVQYPNDTEITRTEYTYDTMYRMLTASTDVDSGYSLSASYTYTDDLLTQIETNSSTYNFTYGAFSQISSIMVGTWTLASYTYTDDANRYLDKLTYGNDDYVQYIYDEYGRVVCETFEGGDTVTYAYDNSGALATVTDSETGIKTTYYYDFTDRLMKYVESGTNYTHSVGYEYDTLNNLTMLVETINGVEHSTSYEYDEDNRVSKIINDAATTEYTYDAYGRVKNEAFGPVEYVYGYNSYNGMQSAQVVLKRVLLSGTARLTLTYSYDDNGNILVYNLTGTNTYYTYDSANQLIREDNGAKHKTLVWTYDDAGNILSRTEYDYTTGELGTAVDTILYSYDDADWGDLLTSYDGVTFSYDGIGNLLTDGTWTYSWEHGRELASMTKGSTTWTYTYDANGMRTSRSNGTTTYTYVYNGSQLTQMTVGNDVLYFTYDAQGHPATVTMNGTVYYYITTMQGDVIAIWNESSGYVADYSYDAWGNSTYNFKNPNHTLDDLNPLRYRGYVWDSETGLYYLQSRYYNPEWGRFINADVFVSTGQGVLGNNMFVYCNNNPVCHADSTGELTDGQIHNSVLSAIVLDYMLSGYYFLSMVNTMIYYNGENIWGGWGFCDLYDTWTGEVWELKKDSQSYTCTTKYAKKQLGKYINGRLASDPDLSLSRGGDLVFGKHTYTISDSNGTYTITYWQEEQGILRYSYTFQRGRTNDYQAIQKARLTCIVIAAPIVVAGFFLAGGTVATVAAIPVVVAFAVAA